MRPAGGVNNFLPKPGISVLTLCEFILHISNTEMYLALSHPCSKYVNIKVFHTRFKTF